MSLNATRDTAATGYGGAPFGVLLLQLGGAFDADTVVPYLQQYFADEHTLRIRGGRVFRKSVAKLLSMYYKPKMQKPYRMIGGSSPMLHYMQKQAAGVEKRLRLRGRDAYVRFATSYVEPTALDALRSLSKDGIRKVVVVCLHPQYSTNITGLVLRDLKKAVDQLDTHFDLRLIDRWYGEADYLDVLAQHVQEALQGFQPAAQTDLALLFCAHASKDTSDEGVRDTYWDDLQATIQGVLSRLDAPVRHRLAVHRPWTPMRCEAPCLDEVVDDLAGEGIKNLLCVPLSFVNDHIETLYEVDLLLRERAEGSGIRDFRRAAALNDDPRFLDVLSRMIERKLVH